MFRKENRLVVTTIKKTKIAIVVKHIIKKGEGCFVATCPDFDITTQGKSIEEANENLKEAVILYLETLDQLGIRDKIFKKRKINIYKPKEKIKIDITPSSNNEPFITTQSISLAC